MPDIIETCTPADELRQHQLARWERGDRVRLEDLLPTFPGLSDNREALVDLIYAEVLLHEEYGESPGLQEYQRRFPHLTEPLRRLFSVHEALAVLDNAPSSYIAGDESTQIDAGLSNPSAISREEAPRCGPYEILEEIGRGGMGIVYKARHPLTGRLAAVKVMRAYEATAEERARFQLEAKAVASLNHPHIVQIYEVFAPLPGEGTPFVALEYIAGGSLGTYINGTPLPPCQAATLLRNLADAMSHAHQAGIVHRDLKPANVLLQISDCRLQNERVTVDSQSAISNQQSAIPKITDFGLAKHLDTGSAQTRTGAVLGTPSYMAPEQAAGQTGQVGPAADIYALGAILYEMLTGRPPFKGATVLETLDQVRHQEPVAPRLLNPAVPRDLETICLKCLHKEPAKRFASCQELADDLTRHLDGVPILARPVGVVERTLKWIKRRPTRAALVVVSGLAALVLVLMWASFTVRLDEQRQNAVDERNWAKKQTDIAQQQSEEAQRQAERASHLLALTAASVDNIAVNVRSSKATEAKLGNAGLVLFKLASFYAGTAKTLSEDRVLSAADRRRLAEQYAVSAVRLLGCAQQIGFFDPSKPENLAALQTDPPLAVLRDRADYMKFMKLLR